MRVLRAAANVEAIPVDFFADPDGVWEYDVLAERAGFDQQWGQLSVGALTEPYAGFPEGAAVVTLTTGQHCSVALVDCTAADDQTVWS
jgi:hypothetical protein